MTQTRGLIIAIDGPAASGKSTTARLVAGRLGYTYIDTGAMYRAVTLAADHREIDPADGPAVERLAGELDISFAPQEDGTNRTLLDGEDVTGEIRRPEISAAVSLVSSWRGVRTAMVDLQRKMAGEGGVVLDGRDIGTVVFPDADLKIFLVADIEERARRRLGDLSAGGVATDLDRVAEDLRERDRSDSTRAESPLRPAADAIHIDTSGLTIDDQVERVIELARRAASKNRINRGVEE